MNSAQLLPIIRQLFSERPEYFHHEPWELTHVLYSLSYVDDLTDEAEIAAAVEVASGESAMEVGGMAYLMYDTQGHALEYVHKTLDRKGVA